MYVNTKTVTFFVAKKGSRRLQELSGSQRAEMIMLLAELLVNRKEQILQANAQDLREAEESGNFLSLY